MRWGHCWQVCFEACYTKCQSGDISPLLGGKEGERGGGGAVEMEEEGEELRCSLRLLLGNVRHACG